MIITAIYAAPLVGLFLVLTARTIINRRTKKISLGHGDDEETERRIRAHANFVEYAPLGILLIAIAESLSAHIILLHLIGLMLLVGRLLHAYGVGGPKMDFKLRTWGMILTLNALALGSVVIFAAAVMQSF